MRLHCNGGLIQKKRGSARRTLLKKRSKSNIFFSQKSLRSRVRVSLSLSYAALAKLYRSEYYKLELVLSYPQNFKNLKAST